jgi:hypothetical protein
MLRNEIARELEKTPPSVRKGELKRLENTPTPDVPVAKANLRGSNSPLRFE